MPKPSAFMVRLQENQRHNMHLQRLKVESGSIVCLGCGHEHNCGIHGCAIIREAVHRLYDFYAVFNEEAVVRLTARCLKVEPGRLRELAEEERSKDVKEVE